MTTHNFGDAPIEPQYAEEMRQMALFIHEHFNGPVPPDQAIVGFLLLVVPMGEGVGRVNYLSNICREDVAQLFRDQLKNFERDGSAPPECARP